MSNMEQERLYDLIFIARPATPEEDIKKVISGIEHTCSVGRTWQRISLSIRRSLNEVTLAQLAGLDTRAPAMPIERELKYMGRAKAAT